MSANLPPAQMAQLNMDNYPYLRRVRRLKDSYPALNSFLDKLLKPKDEGRIVVENAYMERYGRPPGRCCVLEFQPDQVLPHVFDSVDKLRQYLNKTTDSTIAVKPLHRLFILEDIQIDYVEALGSSLGVDPLVFAEQMNTWNFMDVKSVGHRALPSLMRPEKAFTLRYYELRALPPKQCLPIYGNRMTFAANRRYYEAWINIDSRSMPTELPVGFVRRCASFWTSQNMNNLSDTTGWNAILLVDPPIDSFKEVDDAKAAAADINRTQDGRFPKYYILKGPRDFNTRAQLWDSRDINKRFTLENSIHSSLPYHSGCPTMYPLSFASPIRLETANIIEEHGLRNLSSPFDEMIFHWTKIADQDQLQEVRQCSVNGAYYLLKFVAYNWMNQLELISHSLVQSEYFADDNPATKPAQISTREWKEEFYKIVGTTNHINYFRRQMIFFESAMTLNLERLGSFRCSHEASGINSPRALTDAWTDFLCLAARLKPFCKRADNLSTVVNDLASLRAAFKGIEDSEFGLTLSILATIIFPFTLIAAMLSMGGDFSPGQSKFWIFFASSIPLSFVIGLYVNRKSCQEFITNRALGSVPFLHLARNLKEMNTGLK